LTFCFLEIKHPGLTLVDRSKPHQQKITNTTAFTTTSIAIYHIEIERKGLSTHHDSKRGRTFTSNFPNCQYRLAIQRLTPKYQHQKSNFSHDVFLSLKPRRLRQISPLNHIDHLDGEGDILHRQTTNAYAATVFTNITGKVAFRCDDQLRIRASR
jgi:hypothetical protein